MNKLIVAWILENDEDVFPLSYESVKDITDHVVIIDGNEIMKTGLRYDIYKHKQKSRQMKTIGGTYPEAYIHSPFPHKRKGADGIQRNKYLSYLQEHHIGDWCLVLDADEFVDEPEKIKEVIAEAEKNGVDCLSIKMRHYIHNLGQEDATRKEHFVQNRLFKVTKDLHYIPVEHGILQGIKLHAYAKIFTIWHINTARNSFRLHNKYKNNLAKSNVHEPAFLTWWYHAHLFNEYPVGLVPFGEQPQVLKDYLGVNSDYMYFKDRMNLETKHFLDAIHWREYFAPESVLFTGCGAGHRVFAMKSVGVDSWGFDLSEYIIENTPYRSHLETGRLFQGDILDTDSTSSCYDLVVAYDILEHLDEKDLFKALINLRSACNKNLIISVPMIGDPNLYNDVTHKIFQDRAWWEKQVSKAGFKVLEVPSHFNYKHQLIVAEVKDGA